MLSGIAVAATLLMLEAAFRVRASVYDRREGEAFRRMAEARPPQAGSKVGLGRMIRLHPDDRVIYELIPNLSVRFRGTDVATDEDGNRRTGPTPAGGDVQTVVGLGDSFMFGWGVDNNACYLAHLNSWLQGAHSNTSWRVLNMAVPGYNTAMKVAALQVKGLAYKPRLVVLHYVVNDLDLPNFIRTKDSVWTLRRCFLREAFSRKFPFRYQGLNRLVDVPFHAEDGRYKLPDREIPSEYRGLVGLEAFEEAMRTLRSLSETHGFGVIVLSVMRPPDYVIRACKREGLRLVTAEREVREYLRAKGFTRHDRSDLVLSAQDTHPSVAGHRLLADVLIAAIKEGGYLGDNGG